MPAKMAEENELGLPLVDLAAFLHDPSSEAARTECTKVSLTPLTTLITVLAWAWHDLGERRKRAETSSKGGW